jgi:hypothetical protein
MSNGRVVRFNVAPVAPGDACFALGVRKSGSSIFSAMTMALAAYNHLNVVDIPQAMVSAGFRYPDWNGHPKLADLVWQGNVYVGFRDAPSGLYADPIFRAAKKILLVRDPRDALIGEYFSNAYSRSIPVEQAEGSVIGGERETALRPKIESYVMSQVGYLDKTMQAYAPILKDPNLLLLRYEDVIFDKAAWLDRIATHFGWRTEPQLIADILAWADVSPSSDDPETLGHADIPGDHVDKLTVGGLIKVNSRLSPVWRDLGYEVGA